MFALHFLTNVQHQHIHHITSHHIAFLQEVILTSTFEKRMYLMNNSEESQRRGHSYPICTIYLIR